MTFKTCSICGKESLQCWNEREDGQTYHYEDCINPKCGEDESEDEDIE